MRFCLQRAIPPAGLWILLAAIGLCADTANQDFKHAKRQIQTQLRSKESSDRIGALHRLKEYHEPDAAKLIVQMGLYDTTREVRVAAFETLRTYKDDEAVCDYLLATVRKGLKARDGGQGTDVLIAVLLASDREPVEKELTNLLDKQLLTSPIGPGLVALVADDLGSHADIADLLPLRKLTKCKLFEQEFAVRRAVIQAIMRIRDPKSIDELIALMATTKGEARGDIIEYLTAITQQEHKLDAVAWQRWWEKAKPSFVFPPPPSNPNVRVQPVGGAPSTYYGMPLYAQRLVFVFDTSGSMMGERLAAAQRELIQAIERLPNETYFGIVVFNSRVNLWQKDLVPATSANRTAAAHYIAGLQATAMTATYDALSAAFKYDAEAIYLLTDGAPTTGQIVAPIEIVGAVTRGNLPRRLTIYTIGIGVGAEGGLFETFLSELASQNYGQFRRVDE